MYIQITTRCNMTCAHCCFAATHKGKDMSPDTYKQAIRLASDRGDYIFIGGGEPTIHPEFWSFLGLAIGRTAAEYLGIVTNGSSRDTAIALARLTEKGVLHAELSLDQYHDPVDAEVREAFSKLKRVRSVSRIMSVGRGSLIPGSVRECCCDELLVDPEGVIWTCGCKKIKCGSVWDPEIPDELTDENGEWICGKF